MVYKISLPGNNSFSGEHMGLIFTRGEAHTGDAFLASRLKSKGYTVAADEGVGGEDVSGQDEITKVHIDAAEAGRIKLEDMTVPQLKESAAAKGIDLSGARTKAEIISAINAAETGQ